MLLLAYGTQQLLFQVNKCWMLYLSGCACLFRLWSGYLPFDLSFLIGPGKVIEFPFSQLFLLWGKVWQLLSSLHISTEHRFFFFSKIHYYWEHRKWATVRVNCCLLVFSFGSLKRGLENIYSCTVFTLAGPLWGMNDSCGG